MNGDTRLLERIPEFGPVVVEIFAKGLRGCRCLLPLFRISIHFIVLSGEPGKKTGFPSDTTASGAGAVQSEAGNDTPVTLLQLLIP